MKDVLSVGGNCEKTADIAACRKVKEGTKKNFSIIESPLEDHFAYEFRTLMRIPQKGVYRFYTYSDDGSVLYIDGHKVVDNDGGHSVGRAEGNPCLIYRFGRIRIRCMGYVTVTGE